MDSLPARQFLAYRMLLRQQRTIQRLRVSIYLSGNTYLAGICTCQLSQQQTSRPLALRSTARDVELCQDPEHDLHTERTGSPPSTALDTLQSKKYHISICYSDPKVVVDIPSSDGSREATRLVEPPSSLFFQYLDVFAIASATSSSWSLPRLLMTPVVSSGFVSQPDNRVEEDTCIPPG
jgi:hypothetical protein